MDLQAESIFFFQFPSSQALKPFWEAAFFPLFSWPYKCDFILPLLVFTPSPCQLFQTSFSPLTVCVLHLLSLPSLLPPSLQGTRSPSLVPNYRPENCLCQKRMTEFPSAASSLSHPVREKKDFGSGRRRREAQDLRRARRPAGRLVQPT